MAQDFVDFRYRITQKETKKIQVILADLDFRLFSAEGRCLRRLAA